MATTQYEPLPEIAADAAAGRPDLVVMKFGGTSVGDVEKIKDVARRLVRAREEGRRVVGVLSAMGDTTDELIRLAHEISPVPHPREYDMLVSVGERISNALCAMAVHDLGHEAISLTGSQAGIVTDTAHGKAKIAEVRATRINDALDAGKIVLVAGFQGVSADSHDVTTLGRGGSDTTAVALAAALGGPCEIFTDVEGIFTADPRIVPDALKLRTVSYEEMLEMAATGARVMMARSIEIARRYGVALHVRASFNDSEGTRIAEEGDLVLEKAIVSGVTHDATEAKATIVAVPDSPGIAARVFRALADAAVNIDMIVQNVSENGTTDISFTLPKSDLAVAEPILERLCAEIGATSVDLDDEVAKVSLVGAGMKSHPGVAADMFEALAEAGINIEIISTSSIRVSCVVRATEVERAVRAVHDKFRMYAQERVDA
ncbi:MAG TPA: aspartate kinase [Gaiellaceae bacterium]|jgi:aspartate kinase|nr:aspartate kinase [Gaiellaceae bacterium]